MLPSQLYIAILDDDLDIAEQRRTCLLAESGNWSDTNTVVDIFQTTDDLILTIESRKSEEFCYDIIVSDIYMKKKNHEVAPNPNDGGVHIKNWLKDKKENGEEYFRRVQLRWISNTDKYEELASLIRKHSDGKDEWFGHIFSNLEYQQLKDLSFIHGVQSAVKRVLPKISEIDTTGFITNSDKVIAIRGMAITAAASDSNILITGESGTGKEVLAKLIHENSARKQHRFLGVNIASYPRDLIDSELFGHVKGAFTGAVQSKQGILEVVGDGTLFLDEIGELEKSLQVKLLRVLQEKTFCKLGDTIELRFKGRIITATNRNLDDEISEGRFREDLYYRINVFNLCLPPLRERMEDIPILVKHFETKLALKNEKPRKTICNEIIEIFAKHNWPGNVRELENHVERLINSSQNENRVEMDNLAKYHLSTIIPMGYKLSMKTPSSYSSMDEAFESFVAKTYQDLDKDCRILYDTLKTNNFDSAKTYTQVWGGCKQNTSEDPGQSLRKKWSRYLQRHPDLNKIYVLGKAGIWPRCDSSAKLVFSSHDNESKFKVDP